MKNLYAILLLLLSITTSTAQPTFHKYLDSTVEWRTYGTWFTAGDELIRYQINYMDGDTSIAGQWYYKQYGYYLDSVFWGTSYHNTDSFKWVNFVREDATGKIWQFVPTGDSEVVITDWGHIDSLDTSNYFPGELCKIYYIDSVYLGSTPLRRIRPMDTSTLYPTIPLYTNGYIEGIGKISMPCESTGPGWQTYIECYTRDGYDLSLGPISCSEFPLTRSSVPASVALIGADDFALYPNPSDGHFTISTPPAAKYNLEVYNAAGQLVLTEQGVNGNTKRSLYLANKAGLYMVRLVNVSTGQSTMRTITIE